MNVMDNFYAFTAAVCLCWFSCCDQNKTFLVTFCALKKFACALFPDWPVAEKVLKLMW